MSQRVNNETHTEKIAVHTTSVVNASDARMRRRSDGCLIIAQPFRRLQLTIEVKMQGFGFPHAMTKALRSGWGLRFYRGPKIDDPPMRFDERLCRSALFLV
jgi:hypothetical protein